MNPYYMGCGQKLIGTPEELAPELDRMERSGQWVAEPKLDGQWLCVEGQRNGPPRVTARSGRVLDVELGPIVASVRLVGELVNDRPYVFDFLHNGFGDLRGEPYRGRRAAFLASAPGYHLVPRYAADFAWHFASESEGLVLKRWPGGPYVAGKTDEWMKVKRIDRHDVEVVGLDTGKDSARIIHANGPLRGHAAGKVPLCGWPVAVGDVLEIEAFKLYPSGRFRSPVIKRIRQD